MNLFSLRRFRILFSFLLRMRRNIHILVKNNRRFNSAELFKHITVQIGGFESPVIFNEDMFFAAHAVQEGYKVAYAADAEVVHSHNYSVKQQFHRNFDLAVSQTAHPEIFEQVSSEAEGMRLVKNTMGYLCKIHKPYLIWKLGWQCVGRYAGYFLGKRYQKLGRRQILKCTMSPYYWKRIWSEK